MTEEYARVERQLMMSGTGSWRVGMEMVWRRKGKLGQWNPSGPKKHLSVEGCSLYFAFPILLDSPKVYGGRF